MRDPGHPASASATGLERVLALAISGSRANARPRAPSLGLRHRPEWVLALAISGSRGFARRGTPSRTCRHARSAAVVITRAGIARPETPRPNFPPAIQGGCWWSRIRGSYPLEAAPWRATPSCWGFRDRGHPVPGILSSHPATPLPYCWKHSAARRIRDREHPLERLLGAGGRDKSGWRAALVAKQADPGGCLSSRHVGAIGHFFDFSLRRGASMGALIHRRIRKSSQEVGAAARVSPENWVLSVANSRGGGCLESRFRQGWMLLVAPCGCD